MVSKTVFIHEFNKASSFKYYEIVHMCTLNTHLIREKNQIKKNFCTENIVSSLSKNEIRLSQHSTVLETIPSVMG